jgi:DNA-binding response OmpR family regulator
MNAQKSLLVVGKIRPERKRSLTGMAAAAHLSLVHLEEPAEALEWLETGAPGCLLLDGQSPRLDKIIAKVRGKSQLISVPVIALVNAPDELWIEQYFGWGGDDIVDQDAGASLLDRLKAASKELPKSVLGRRVLLADPEPNRVSSFSRAFTLAGFEVKTVADRKALEAALKLSEPAVVVVNAVLGDVPALVAQSRATRPRTGWVVLAPRRELEPLQQALLSQPRAVTLGLTSSPWHVLYRANEVIRVTGAERRAEPRRLVGSSVLFRAAGGDDDDIGVCYNVSTRGMFLRTHAPLAADRVWIEWRVPHDKTRLRVEGRVAWRYAGESDGLRPSTPFGFGVEFVDYLGNALSLLERAMDVLESAGKKSLSPLPAAAPFSPASSRPPAAAAISSASPRGSEPNPDLPTAALTKLDVSSTAPPVTLSNTHTHRAPSESNGNLALTKTNQKSLDLRTTLKGAPGGLLAGHASPLPKPGRAAPLPPRPLGTPVAGTPGGHPAAAATTPGDANLAVTATHRPEEPNSERHVERTLETPLDGLLSEAEGPASSERTDVQRNPLQNIEGDDGLLAPPDDCPTAVTALKGNPLTLPDSDGRIALRSERQFPAAMPIGEASDVKATAPFHPRISPEVMATRVSENHPKKTGHGKASLFALSAVLLLGIAGAALALRSRSISATASKGRTPAAQGRSGAGLDLGETVLAQRKDAPRAASDASGAASNAGEVAAAPSAANGDAGDGVASLFVGDAVAIEEPSSELPGYPPVDEPQAGKGRLLADRYGYLVVRFPEPAFIFSENIAIGPVNSKIATTCGEKTLRIGVGEKPTTYLSDAAKVTVPCRGTSRMVFRRLPGVVAPPFALRPIAKTATPGAADGARNKEAQREGSPPGRVDPPAATTSTATTKSPEGAASAPKVEATDESVFNSRE